MGTNFYDREVEKLEHIFGIPIRADPETFKRKCTLMWYCSYKSNHEIVLYAAAWTLELKTLWIKPCKISHHIFLIGKAPHPNIVQRRQSYDPNPQHHQAHNKEQVHPIGGEESLWIEHRAYYERFQQHDACGKNNKKLCQYAWSGAPFLPNLHLQIRSGSDISPVGNIQAESIAHKRSLITYLCG